MRSAWDALVPAWVLYALIATAFLALNMPPYQNADEIPHFLRADQLSQFQLVGELFDDGRNSGGLAAPGIEASAILFAPIIFHPERQVTRGQLDPAGKIGWQGQLVITSFKNTSIYPPVFYAPSVLAIWVGKLAGMPVVRTLILARVLTGLACCAVIAAALSICVRCGAVGAGALIFALATLPMSLALQNACSQDGLMLAVSALAAALFAQSRNRPRAGGTGWMSLCLALVAMARPPYLPLALLPLAAPGRARWAGALLIVAACLGWVAIAVHFAMYDTSVERGGNLMAQMWTLLDPAHDVALVIGTSHDWEAYLAGFIGQLGWLDTGLPRAYYIGAAVYLLGLAALVGFRGQRSASGSALLLVIAVLLSVLLVFLAEYLTWSQVGLDHVDGVQGRYFLPLALMLAGAVAGLPHGGLERAIRVIVVLFPTVSLGIVMHAVISRYYLGS